MVAPFQQFGSSNKSVVPLGAFFHILTRLHKTKPGNLPSLRLLPSHYAKASAKPPVGKAGSVAGKQLLDLPHPPSLNTKAPSPLVPPHSPRAPVHLLSGSNRVNNNSTAVQWHLSPSNHNGKGIEMARRGY